MREVTATLLPDAFVRPYDGRMRELLRLERRVRKLEQRFARVERQLRFLLDQRDGARAT